MADFTALPDNTIEEERQNNTLINNSENGAETRRRKWTSKRRRWKLSFVNRKSAEMEVVRDFHDLKNGTFTAFTWNRPATVSEAASEITVRFESDVFSFTQDRYDNFSFDITLIEVL
jgi:hypothetical protein